MLKMKYRKNGPKEKSNTTKNQEAATGNAINVENQGVLLSLTTEI